MVVVGCDAAEHPHDHLARGNQENGDHHDWICVCKETDINSGLLARRMEDIIRTWEIKWLA